MILESVFLSNPNLLIAGGISLFLARYSKTLNSKGSFIPFLSGAIWLVCVAVALLYGASVHELCAALLLYLFVSQEAAL